MQSNRIASGARTVCRIYRPVDYKAEAHGAQHKAPPGGPPMHDRVRENPCARRDEKDEGARESPMASRGSARVPRLAVHAHSRRRLTRRNCNQDLENRRCRDPLISGELVRLLTKQANNRS